MLLPRAQRLAASTEKPLCINQRSAVCPFVLNALRHQRKNHLRSLRLTSHRTRLCAQRLAASTEKPHYSGNSASSVSVKCSTPCGINGKTTRSNASSPTCNACAQRLAASTEKPQTTTARKTTFAECSTPCGINGKTTAVDVTICAVWT